MCPVTKKIQKLISSLDHKKQPVCFVAPLDLTQQSGLLWTKAQVAQLSNIFNVVAQQMARLSNVVPYIDALHFPEGTFPQHDPHAVLPIGFPEEYLVTLVSMVTGAVGEIIINPNATLAQKNVFILSMNVTRQQGFWEKVLVDFQNFNYLNQPNSQPGLTSAQIAWLAAGIAAACSIALGTGTGLYFSYKKCRAKTQDNSTTPLLTAGDAPKQYGSKSKFDV
jgi:hypothetical protein